MTDQRASGGYRSAILNLDSLGAFFVKVDIFAIQTLSPILTPRKRCRNGLTVFPPGKTLPMKFKRLFRLPMVIALSSLT
jgi:hypothetical protein